jgi:hypothetical protein
MLYLLPKVMKYSRVLQQGRYSFFLLDYPTRTRSSLHCELQVSAVVVAYCTVCGPTPQRIFLLDKPPLSLACHRHPNGGLLLYCIRLRSVPVLLPRLGSGSSRKMSLTSHENDPDVARAHYPHFSCDIKLIFPKSHSLSPTTQ